jgi:hypothetical protein
VEKIPFSKCNLEVLYKLTNLFNTIYPYKESLGECSKEWNEIGNLLEYINSLENEGDAVNTTLRFLENASNSIITNPTAPIPEMKDPIELTLFHT